MSDLTGWAPDRPVPIPPRLREIVGDRRFAPVWRNQLGGLTVAIETPDGRVYAKWSDAGTGVDLADEAHRLRWAWAWIPVPEVVSAGVDEDGSWLITKAIPGENAVSARWLAEPDSAVRAIGTGLRRMHDRLPVADCPFTWSVAERLAAVAPDRTFWHAEHRRLSDGEVRAMLGDAPAMEDPVVCHGDACAPNTLIDASGRCTGQVDLGRLGVADRWADLAIATWSATWNYGPGWETVLLDAYGVELDAERTAYYRLLWDVSPQ